MRSISLDLGYCLLLGAGSSLSSSAAATTTKGRQIAQAKMMRSHEISAVTDLAMGVEMEMEMGMAIEEEQQQQFEYGDGDLFEAPISAEICMELQEQEEAATAVFAVAAATANSTHNQQQQQQQQQQQEQQQLVLDHDISTAFYEISLQNDVLMYDCQGLSKPFTDCSSSCVVVGNGVQTSCHEQLMPIDEDQPVIAGNGPKNSSSVTSGSSSSSCSICEVVPAELSCFPSPKKAKELQQDQSSNRDTTLDALDQSRENLPKVQRSLSSHELGQCLPSYLSSDRSGTFVSPVAGAVSSVYISSGSLDPEKPFLNSLSNFQRLNIKPSYPPMRRVCSTGDINLNSPTTPRQSLMPSTESVASSEPNCLIWEEKEFRIGQYTAEERKKRINRYRMKRNERNFNRKIKYACRKSLADNQPRIRGRFAPKSQEVGRSSPKELQLEERKGDLVWLDPVLYELSVVKTKILMVDDDDDELVRAHLMLGFTKTCLLFNNVSAAARLWTNIFVFMIKFRTFLGIFEAKEPDSMVSYYHKTEQNFMQYSFIVVMDIYKYSN